MIKCDKENIEIKGSDETIGAEIGFIIYQSLEKEAIDELLLDMIIAKVKDMHRKGRKKDD